MIQKEFILRSESGMHARPASDFVKTAGAFISEVTVNMGSASYNGKSILGLMAMGAGFGTRLVLLVEGPDEEAAAEALLRILENMG